MTAGLLMAVCWKWLKQRGVVPRMTVAVVAGWVFTDWARGLRNERGFAKEFAGEARITDTSKGRFDSGRAGLIYERIGGYDDEMIVWEVDGALVDEKGREYVNSQNKESKVEQIPTAGVRGVGRNWIARSLVEEGWIYLDAQNRDEVVDHDRNPRIEVNLPKGYSRGEEVELSGRLVGKRYRVDCLVDRVPFGDEVKFRRGDVLGSVERRKRYSGDQEELHLEVTMPLLGDRYEKDYRKWFDQNWVYHLSYPESRVVSEGQSNFKGSDGEIGGVKRRSVKMEFRNMNWRRFVRKGEKLLLSIYRVVVEEVGHVKVNSERLVLIPQEVPSPGIPSFETEARWVNGPPSSAQWNRRPSPVDGNREEVGAWLRELSRKHRYVGKKNDLAQYADKFGDLFLKRGTRRSWFEREAFIDGATDDCREIAVEELAASVLVERGWVGEAKEKVANLIEEGHRGDEVLRLGIFLGLRGIEEAVLEGLVSSDSWPLYEAARTRMNLKRILDDRLQRVDKATQRVLFRKRGDFRFDSTRWLWLLHEGRKKDLERCLFWMRKAHESGQIDDRNDDYSNRLVFKNVLFDHEQFQLFAEEGKLHSKFFTWDPVLRRWNFNKKEMTK